MSAAEDDYIVELTDQLTGFGPVTTILQIQRASGALYPYWPGARTEYQRRDGYGWGPDYRHDAAQRRVWPTLSLDQTITLLIEAKANIRACPHEHMEKTGEAIPMGSFTAEPERCQRCGLRRVDD